MPNPWKSSQGFPAALSPDLRSCHPNPSDLRSQLKYLEQPIGENRKCSPWPFLTPLFLLRSCCWVRLSPNSHPHSLPLHCLLQTPASFGMCSCSSRFTRLFCLRSIALR